MQEFSKSTTENRLGAPRARRARILAWRVGQTPFEGPERENPLKTLALSDFFKKIIWYQLLSKIDFI